jgi:hypothetical protein
LAGEIIDRIRVTVLLPQIPMPALPRVFAYRDSEPMGPTRWAPRKTLCTDMEDHSDLPGKPYVVKFCQGAQGASAMISEVVCRELFRAGGLHVLDPVIVQASEPFVKGWNELILPQNPIVPGEYFGTAYIADPWGGSIESLQQVETPKHLSLIWLFDCLICNIDRQVRGNLMLIPRGDPPKLRVVPADNSDCFCGSLAFSNGQWRELMKRQGGANGVLVPQAIAAVGGEVGIRIELDTVRLALDQVGNAFDQVPREWWERANIRPEQIEESLWERFAALPNLINVDQWAGGFRGDETDGIPLIQL